MDDPSLLHRAVAEWYRRNARDLPWRGASDPYAILVSEVMLQQTQVDRVIPKYAAFLEAFPTLQALAEAAPADVIRVWAGMGYNARAVRLHRLAGEVMQHHGGRLPESAPELLRLPGIGPYTAAAVACFAFGAAEPVLDTNIYRVLSRVAYGIEAPARTEIDRLAPAMLPRNGEISASDWHQGLMDIGAGICTSSRPRCMLCPLREDCAAAPYLQSDNARELADASVPYAPKQSRFEGSARYFRGRIVAFLREQPDAGASTAEIEALVEATEASQGVRAPVATEVLLAALERDGLVVRGDGRVRLP